MNIIERVIYTILFLLNKYLDIKFTDWMLNCFENLMIVKYVNNKVPPTKIPTVNANELTNDLFVELSDNFKIPVLIKGYMNDTNAVKKWDLLYLRNIIGGFHMNMLTLDAKVVNCSFGDFCDQINDNKLYINNNHTILSHFPVLFDDIKNKFYEFVDTIYSTNLRNIHIANLFIGYDNDKMSGSNMHCGGSGNFFCMLQGKKRWTLIDPKYSCLLKGRAAESGIHAQTLFDMPDTKLDIYPDIFDRLPRYDIVMEPGDILWNAPWWWHRIENHEGLSIGLAIRNNKVTKLNLINNLTYTLSGYTYLLYNSLVINLYEKLMLNKDEHFGKSSDEKGKDNVLFQIEKLIKKYPKTINLDDIYNND